MADTEIQDLTELAQGDIDNADPLVVVDISDTTDDADGTTKKFLWSSLLTDVAAHIASLTQTLTNKTITNLNNKVFARAINIEVRNSSGSAMSKGDVVFVSGYNIGQDLPEVELADADGSSTFPVFGLIGESIANNASGAVCVSGRMSGLDTSSFSAGDTVYMSTTAGEFSTKPMAATAEVQQIGTVLRSNASQGVLEILGADRVNDIPNKQTTDMFRIADSTDDTKLVDVDASGLTTGTTRTLTIKDKSGTLTLDEDTDVSGNAWVLDEDNMASDSATKVATQQSIKAFIASQISSSILGATNTNVVITTGEATLWSATIPADALGTANGYEVIIPVNAVDFPAFSRTLTLKLKYGSTTVCEMVINNNAAQGDMAGHIIGSIFATATNVQFGFLSMTVAAIVGSDARTALAQSDDGTAAEDSTGALTLSVTATPSASDVELTALGGYAKKLIA